MLVTGAPPNLGGGGISQRIRVSRVQSKHCEQPACVLLPRAGRASVWRTGSRRAGHRFGCFVKTIKLPAFPLVKLQQFVCNPLSRDITLSRARDRHVGSKSPQKRTSWVQKFCEDTVCSRRIAERLHDLGLLGGMKINFKLLGTFLAVADNSSFRKAGEQTHLSLPAVSSWRSSLAWFCSSAPPERLT